MANKLQYIDLFAGCGGLSLGFEASAFDLLFAVEKSPMAAETFYHNLIKSIEFGDWNNYLKLSMQEQVHKKLFVGDTKELLEAKNLLKNIKDSITDLDLIVGGPPCQGFSLAGRRNPKDERNELPWQFLEFVKFFKPKAVLMENVVGIRQNFRKSNQDAPFKQIKKYLENTSPEYIVQELQLNAMHYGVPQHRPRVMLLAIRSDIAKRNQLSSTNEIWYSDNYFDNNMIPIMCPKPTIKSKKNFLTVNDAIADLIDNKYDNKKYLHNLNHKSGFKKVVKNKTKELQNHIDRKHSDKVKLRFRLYQYLMQYSVSNKILNIVSEYKISKCSDCLIRINNELDKCEFPAYAPDNYLLAKNKNMFIDLILELGTKKHSQRPLKINSPSPTVVSIPDDIVHPIFPRTMTVREQARFQSFPDYFEFKSKETTGGEKRKIEVPQYTQVGNAVPPLLSKELAKLIKKLIT